jgi:predicted metal-dependent phosphoesterase TrpH
MKLKLDLHTHSVASHDGGITAIQYENAISRGMLDIVAITDHNRIDFAQQLNKQLGEKIIIGEEIMTSEGEIIGLFLKKLIKPGLDAQTTVAEIRKQNGLVYIPHPFETFRKGLSLTTLEKILKNIDMIEVFNGRALLQNKHKKTTKYAKLHDIPAVASSDAHGVSALGGTYTLIATQPKPSTLKTLVSTGITVSKKPSASALLYPKYNKIMKLKNKT